MSETFTGKQGTVFHVVNDEFIRTERPCVGGTISFDLPLADLLEFADSIERRECGPVAVPLSERTKLLATMAATIASGYVSTGTGEWDTDGVLVEAEAILETIEKEARL